MRKRWSGGGEPPLLPLHPQAEGSPTALQEEVRGREPPPLPPQEKESSAALWEEMEAGGLAGESHCCHWFFRQMEAPLLRRRRQRWVGGRGVSHHAGSRGTVYVAGPKGWAAGGGRAGGHVNTPLYVPSFIMDNFLVLNNICSKTYLWVILLMAFYSWPFSCLVFFFLTSSITISPYPVQCFFWS